MKGGVERVCERGVNCKRVERGCVHGGWVRKLVIIT